MNIELMPLLPFDRDLTELIRIHSEPSAAKYISISDDYFTYVVNTKDVVYYKILVDDKAVGGIHCEHSGSTLYLSICVDEEHRRLGIAENALRQLFANVPTDTNTVEISIDELNDPSIQLFHKLGFIEIGRKDGLLSYRFLLT